MRNMSKLFLYFLITTSLVFLTACSNADAEQKSNDGFIIKAKKATKKYNLTKTSMSCLIFEKVDGKIDGKIMVDVREKHGGACGGDPKTSPRLYSIGFEEAAGEIWSDAKSLLGQLEKLQE